MTLLTNLLKGVLLCTLSFFLAGCAKSFTWNKDEIHSYCHDSDLRRIRSVKKTGFCGLELEIILRQDEERVYINVHGLPLPPGESVMVHGTIEGQTYDWQASLMEGGQRLLLDDDAAQVVLDTLWDEKPVTLTVGPYTKEFESDNFPELYSP